MAIYEVRNHRNDIWDEDNSKRRFSTRPPADELFEEEAQRGRFVRLIRWHDYELTELRRFEGQPQGQRAPG